MGLLNSHGFGPANCPAEQTAKISGTINPLRKLARKRNSSFECGDGVKNGEETESPVAHCRQLSIAPEGLRGWDRRWEFTSKQTEAVALLVRGHRYRVSEVATCLRRDQAHVSTMLSRLSAPHSFAEGLFKIIASFDFLRALRGSTGSPRPEPVEGRTSAV